MLAGRSVDAGHSDPERLRAAVATLDADVVALQEVDSRLPRSGYADQAPLAATALAAAELRFLPTLTGTPGVRGWRPVTDPPERVLADPAGEVAPGYGIALVSRIPVDRWYGLRLFRGRGRYPLIWTRHQPFVHWVPDEPRAILAAVLREPRMTVACTHLSFVPGVNAVQLRQVVRWLSRLPAPQVLLGDLNLPGSLSSWLTSWTPLVHGATFPSHAPRAQLDHALATGLPPGSSWQSSVQPQLPVSDHRAIRVDLHVGPLPLGPLQLGPNAEA